MSSASSELVGPSSRMARYARVLKAAKQIEWQIDRDVLQDRRLDFSKKFLPDGLSLIGRLDFLSEGDGRFLSQVQGRTYAYLFRLVERFIGAKALELAHGHALIDQSATDVLVRSSNDEIKHQEMFRRLEDMMAVDMPTGYQMTADAGVVAATVLASSTWSVLALTCHIELVAQAHYEQSIAPREEICPLFRDIFRFHWRDECQHVLVDELEWTGEHERLTPTERDHAVEQFIALLGVMDRVLCDQAKADAAYFVRNAVGLFTVKQQGRIESAIHSAYRWQYIVSGMQHVHFARLLTSMSTGAQAARIGSTLASMLKM